MALANNLSSLNAHIRANQVAVTATTLSGLLVLLPVLSYGYKSYREWLSLGPGGVPYNIVGWMAQGLYQLVARPDTFDPSPFSQSRVEAKYKPHGRRSFLNHPLPTRAGGRPRVPGFVAPQRQVTETGTAESKEQMDAYLRALAAANASVLAMKPSGLEGGTPALFLTDDETTTQGAGAHHLRRIRGELAHVHPEASSHATLSLADAEEVARKGWGERHRLSGSVLAGLPWGYVLLYAPRDEDELEVFKQLVYAGLQFACADGPDVQNA